MSEHTQERYEELFLHYIRTGEAQELRECETALYGPPPNPDGGYLAPDRLRRVVTQLVLTSICTKQPEVSRARRASGQQELYAMPSATSTLLDDSSADLAVWLAEEVMGPFSQQVCDMSLSGYVYDANTPLRILRDPYTAKPYVLFYATQKIAQEIEPLPREPERDQLVEALATALQALVPTSGSAPDWWCPNCQQDIGVATNSEHCPGCGTYLSDVQPDQEWLTKAQDALSKYRREK